MHTHFPNEKMLVLVRGNSPPVWLNSEAACLIPRLRRRPWLYDKAKSYRQKKRVCSETVTLDVDVVLFRRSYIRG